MAISTQTEALIELYNQKNTLDAKQLSQVALVQEGYNIKTGIGVTEQIKIWGVNEVISNYNTPIEKLDNKIIEINSQINTFQSQILSLGRQANSVGCGTNPISSRYYNLSTILLLLYYNRTNFTFVSNVLTIALNNIVVVYKDDLRYRGYTYLAPVKRAQG